MQKCEAQYPAMDRNNNISRPVGLVLGMQDVFHGKVNCIIYFINRIEAKIHYINKSHLAKLTALLMKPPAKSETSTVL